MDRLRTELEKAPCIEPFTVTVPQPSRQAEQISWGREFRDVERRRVAIRPRGRILKPARISPIWLVAISTLVSTVVFYLIYTILVG